MLEQQGANLVSGSCRSRSARSHLSAMAAVAIVLSLSGCDFVSNHSDNLALRMTDGTTQLAVCESIVATGIEMYAREGSRSPWTSYWSASGHTEMGPGSILDTKNLGGYFSNVKAAADPVVSSDGGFDVVVNSDSGGLFATFELRGITWEGGSWLHPGGEITREPCGSQ